MNIVSATETWSGISWGGDLSQRTTVRCFTVETDEPGRGGFDFPVTSGSVTIPAQGTPHPDDPDFISGVPQITARGPTYFEIRTPYTAQGLSGGEEPNPNIPPLDQPADVSWEDEEPSLPYDTDVTGQVVQTALGEMINPPLTRTISDPVLVIERNEAAFHPDTKLDYQDTICEETFWGAAPGRARMGKIRARSVHAATPYWRVGYRVVFRMNTPEAIADADAWKRSILHQGSLYADDDGHIFETPNGTLALLDEDGKLVPSGGTPHWLYFTEFKNKSWGPLSINDNEITL